MHLLNAAADNLDQPLVIQADAITPHQAVVRAMDAAGQIGMRRIGIATQQSEDTE